MRGDFGRRRSIIALVAAGVVSLAGLVIPSAARADTGAVGVTSSGGATVVAQTRVSDRMVDLTIASPALKGNGKVRVILPENWSTTSGTTWPSLYLLHGANEPEDYRSWTVFTDVERFMADKDVLVVMPTDGGSGMYSATWDYGFHSGPDYETFHTEEIPEIMSRAFHADDRRVVAGLSIGGLGAFSYAARHPGLFRAAASYSGLLDSLMPGGPAFVMAIRVWDEKDPVALWGSPVLHRSLWQAHNPTDLVDDLHGVSLYVSSGDGDAGDFDDGFAVDGIEPLARMNAESFLGRARAAGLSVRTHLYDGGTHTWPYWERELHRSWPLLADGLGLSA
jgi:S-formylglutathione hydrolase FrmB